MWSHNPPAQASAPPQSVQACQRHQAVLLDPGREAAGCGELQAVWDAQRGFDYARFEELRRAYRRRYFPELPTDVRY